MAKLIHQSPLGDLEIPTMLDVVPPGTPFDVDDDIALSLLAQGDVFRLVDVPKVSFLRDLATSVEIDGAGLDRHGLVAALATAQVTDLLSNHPQEVQA